MTDKNGLVWVTNRTDFQVFIINPRRLVDEIIDTNLTPLSTTLSAPIPAALGAPGSANLVHPSSGPRGDGQDELTQMAAALQGGIADRPVWPGPYLLNSSELHRARERHRRAVRQHLFQVFFKAATPQRGA